MILKINYYIIHQILFSEKKIKKEGLIIKCDTWGLKNDSIYNTHLDKAIFCRIDEPYDNTYDDDIYLIDTSELNNIFYKDKECDDKCVYTLTNIPKKYIKLIYKGTGN